MAKEPSELTFPSGSFFKKREGSIITVNGHDFRLTRVLKESNSWQVEWTVIFEADMISTTPPQPVILKFRYE